MFYERGGVVTSLRCIHGINRAVDVCPARMEKNTFMDEQKNTAIVPFRTEVVVCRHAVSNWNISDLFVIS